MAAGLPLKDNVPMLTPHQKASSLRGKLADALRCRIENTDDRKDCHLRLDALLDYIEKLESSSKDKPISTTVMRLRKK